MRHRLGDMHRLFRLCRGIDVSRCNCQIHGRWKIRSLITDSASEYQRHNLRETRERETRRVAILWGQLGDILDKQRFVLKRESVSLQFDCEMRYTLWENLSFGVQVESIIPVHTGKTVAEAEERRNAHETIYPRTAKAKHRTVVSKEQINFFSRRSIAPKHFSRYTTTRSNNHFHE